MNDKRVTHISKFLSLVLRHKPDEIGVELDPAGWTDINALLAAIVRHLIGYPEAIVATAACGGDVDTNCAIVGGIVALSAGPDCIPIDWLRLRERFLE